MTIASYKTPPLKEAGQFHFIEERVRDEDNHVGYVNTGMVFMCPCGCGDLTRLSFKSDANPMYVWDGNKVTPTVTPATPKANCGNAYWLTNGEFTNVTEY